MILPIFIKIGKDGARFPLQLIASYCPADQTSIPTLKVDLNTEPMQTREIQFETAEELNNAVENLDRLCSTIVIPTDNPMQFGPEGQPPGSPDGGVTIQ